MTTAQDLRNLIRDAEALLERLDEYPSSPAAAHMASAIDALRRLLEQKILPPGAND